MRKHSLLILFAALCCNGLFAQDFDDEIGDDRSFRVAVGPKVGVGVGFGSHSNMENLSFTPSLSYQAGMALNAHFGRRYEMSDGGTGWVGAEMEVLYGMHAVKLGNNTLGVSCVEVPVLVQFYPIPTLAFEAGVTMVKGLSCTPDEIRVESHILGVGEMKPNDVMLSVGANYKASFGLSVGLRYNQGMSNLAGNFDTKISTVMFSVAYLFTIVK